MHGCTNPNCRTPTCLSNQKRTSRAPFRRFTVLSARALATYLAARGISEHDLCPHQPVALSEEPEIRLCQEKSNEETEGFVESKEKSKKVRKRKDFKSFTQNFFDTEAMKTLQLETVKDSFLGWAPSFKREEDASLAEGCENRTRPVARNINAKKEKMDKCRSPESGKSAENLIEQTRNITDGEPESSPYIPSPCLESEGGTAYQSYHQNETKIRSNSISSASCLSKKSENSSAQKKIQNVNHKTALAGLATEDMINESELEKKPLPGRIGHRKNGTREVEKTTKHVIGEDRTIIPLNHDLDPVERPQTLARFTLENISALVSTVENITHGPHDECKYQQSFGRTPKASRLSAFLGGTATEQEMNIAFGTQSIIYVLSTTDSLLRSFLCPAEPGLTDSKTSVQFFEIVQAFRLLMQIDYLPSNIISSLWISVGKLHPPTSFRSKSALIKACRSIRSDRLPFSIDLDNQVADIDVIPDLDAAHIAKIALAALVATVPECDPKTLSRVQKFRASGRIVPESPVLSSNEQFTNLTLNMFDSFDDEMGLNLIKRLVRAITARQCLSEFSKYQEPSMMRSDTSINQGEDFMDILVREISGVEAIQTTIDDLHIKDVSDSFVHGKIQHQGAASVFNLPVLVEWLRGLILTEWDGKAEVSKWGLVGGALELMSYLRKLIMYSVLRCSVASLTPMQIEYLLHLVWIQKSFIPLSFPIGLI